MAGEKELARRELAQRGLSREATELVGRTVLSKIPIASIDRARALLTRFFDGGPWSGADDSALAAVFGPGHGWQEEPVAPDIVVGFGWRNQTFRIDVRPSATGLAPAPDAAGLSTETDNTRTLGDTFDLPINIDSRSGPTARLGMGPGAGGRGRFTRDGADADPRVDAVCACPAVEHVELGAGWVEVAIGDASRWGEVLLPLLDVVDAQFSPARPAPDRQIERAQREVGTLNPESARDLLRIVDALTSPNASYRSVAVAMLETADGFAAERAWRSALDDQSRAVRHAASRAMAAAGREELRPLYERALTDHDACVRYYGLRGLAKIGIVGSSTEASKLLGDDDLRVRVTAETAVMGEIPA